MKAIKNLCLSTLSWICIGLANLCWIAPASAQQFVQFATPQDGQNDIQITATDSMSFDNGAGTFEAIGETQTLSGAMVIFSDRVVATYVTNEAGARTVEKFSAYGNVFVVSDGLEGQSSQMDANLKNESYDFFGEDVQISTGDGRIFSDRAVTVNQSDGVVLVQSSPGQSFMLRGEQTISADQLRLLFASASAGENDENATVDGDLGDLESFEAQGNVRGDIGGTQLSSDALISDSTGVEIQLFGNVRINQDGTVLGGNCMTFNSDTGNTSLFKCPAGANDGGRVFGQLQLTQ